MKNAFNRVLLSTSFAPKSNRQSSAREQVRDLFFGGRCTQSLAEPLRIDPNSPRDLHEHGEADALVAFAARHVAYRALRDASGTRERVLRNASHVKGETQPFRKALHLRPFRTDPAS